MKPVQHLWERISRRGPIKYVVVIWEVMRSVVSSLLFWRNPSRMVLAIMVLFVLALLAFQSVPLPSPTPLINFVPQSPEPTVDGDRLWDLVEKALPLLLGGGALVIALGQKQVAKAGVQVDAQKVDVDRERIFNDFARENAADVRKSREASEIAAEMLRQSLTANSEMNSALSGMKGENEGLRGQLTVMEDRIKALETGLKDRSRELQEERDYSRRLNVQLLEYAAASIPPNAPMQQPQQQQQQPDSEAQLGTSENPMTFEISNTKKNPVPTVVIPDATVIMDSASLLVPDEKADNEPPSEEKGTK